MSKSIFVLDASVALKWFFIREPKSDQALKILEHLQNHHKNYIVPDLFFAETFSVLSRFLKDESSLNSKMWLLQELGLERIALGRQVIEKSAFFATKYNMRGYDAIYVACADLTGGIWLTADEEAHRKIKSLKISVLL